MISAQDFKQAMAGLAGAVTVITTRDEHGQPQGFTATAFSQEAQSDWPLAARLYDHRSLHRPHRSAERERGRGRLGQASLKHLALARKLGRTGGSHQSMYLLQQASDSLHLLCAQAQASQ